MAQFRFAHQIGAIFDARRRVNGEKTKARVRRARHVFGSFEVIGVGAPIAIKVFALERGFGGVHHCFGSAIGARHFADALLRENRREIEVFRRVEMAGRCQA